MEFTLSRAACSGDPRNTGYPIRESVTSCEQLVNAIAYDHMCGSFKGGKRAKESFLSTNVIVMDCDNEGSDDPKAWVGLNDLDELFGFDTAFVAVSSKSHMKPKGKKSARPRFHVYFPVEEIDSADECAAFKQKIQKEYPFFDKGALDAARFIYGHKGGEVLWHDGNLGIDQVANQVEITEGNRNTAMSRFAARLLIRLGDCDEAYEGFCQRAKQCKPPLDEDELLAVWGSARKFYAKVSKLPGYVPPEVFEEQALYPHQPKRKTDVGEAIVLAKFAEKRMRYSPATKFLVYEDGVWKESDELAHQVMHDLTEAQIADVQEDLLKARAEFENRNLAAKFTTRKALRKGESLSDTEAELIKRLEECESYYNLAVYYQESKHLKGALEEVKPKILISVNDLDANPYLLNTPMGTLDLKTAELKAHDPMDYITKMTDFHPSMKGMNVWNEALQTFFCGDQELIDYVQQVMGQVLIGCVKEEKLYIFYGDGRNGKSTFTNTCARVLGNYAGAISASVLTQNAKGNVMAQLAEVKGLRLLVASELESNQQLSASTAKTLSSTDSVYAEKKFKAPFKFKPTHSLILHTNHLPNVTDYDTGIWRRLTVIPFEAVIEGNGDIKDYTSYLVENAGEAVLQWMIDGARIVIANQEKIILPKRVLEATNAYKQESDWISDFIEECCVVKSDVRVKALKLYEEYRRYCDSHLEKPRNRKTFKDAIIAKGFKHKKLTQGYVYGGICIRSEFEESLTESSENEEDLPSIFNDPDLPF